MINSDPHSRIDFFEKIAPHYDLLLDLLSFRQYVRFLRGGLKILSPRSGERLLDLCSGTGRVASWMSQAVGEKGEVVGLDISEAMVQVSRKRYGGMKNLFFLQKDITREWFDQNHFDGIFTSFALHELPGKYRSTILEKSFLALKKEGRLVIADMNPQPSRLGRIVLQTFFRLFEKENLNFLSFDQDRILRETGFKKIRKFPVLGGLLQITLAGK